MELCDTNRQEVMGMSRILIVEDEQAIANLVRTVLTDAGYQCTWAADGMQAADLLENNSFDLALLDIMLPGADGYELLEYCKSLEIPVIFLSAKGDVEDRVKGLRAGAEDYLAKPFALNELLARVDTVLRRCGKGSGVLKILKKIDWKKYTSIIGLILLCIISIILNDSFLTPRNLINIIRQLAVPGLLAIGMTYVIISGGIDLSVGSICALVSVLYAMLLQKGMNFFTALIIMMLLGLVIGLCYGFFAAKVAIPPFIVTLAGTNVCKGAALVLTDSAAIGVTEPVTLAIGSLSLPQAPTLALIALAAIYCVYNMWKQAKEKAFHWISIIYLLILAYAAYLILNSSGVPYLALICIALVIIFNFVLNHTVFGKGVYAVGGNIDVARMAGVKTVKVLVSVYVVDAMLAALGGVLTAARLGAGAPTIGTNWELDAIAAVVIGGTSMNGGSGKLTKTVIGVLLIGVLNNMLSLMNVQTNVQMIFKGLIILGAVVLDKVTSSRRV